MLKFNRTFHQSFANLAKASPEKVVRQLHKMFSDISKLDHREVVIAYQTIETAAKAKGLEDCPVIDGLKKAVLARMQYLAQISGGRGDKQRRKLYECVSGLPSSAFIVT